jgi:hypothetical protein
MNIAQSGQIIDAAALVHNFTIDEREGVDQDTLDVFDEETYFQQFSANTVNELDDSQILERPVAIVTDNNEPNPGGRRSVASMDSKKEGSRLRRMITIHLSLYECLRPTQKGFKYNDVGMIYMDY